MREMTEHFKNCHKEGKHYEMQDPTAQYLKTCSPIGSPRINLGMLGFQNLRIDTDEEKLRRMVQMKKLPSPSAHIDESKPFTLEQLEPQTWEQKQQDAKNVIKTREVKMAPAVARAQQQQKRLMDEEYKRMLLSQERRAKKEKWEHFKRTGFVPKKQENDNEDFIATLREKAKNRTKTRGKAKIDISHLSRQHKHQVSFDKQRCFQLQFDFEGLIAEVNRERKNVYVTESGEQMLKAATNSIAVNSQKRHKYLSRAQHKARLQRAKVSEKKRREEIRTNELRLLEKLEKEVRLDGLNQDLDYRIEAPLRTESDEIQASHSNSNKQNDSQSEHTKRSKGKKKANTEAEQPHVNRSTPRSDKSKSIRVQPL